MAITAIAIATALCGCPSLGLKCDLITFDSALGTQTATPLYSEPGNKYPGEQGVYLRFTGDEITGGYVKFILANGKDESIPLVNADPDKAAESDLANEKCLECVPAALAGAHVVAGVVVPTILGVMHHEANQPVVTDVAVPVGNYVKEYIVHANTKYGEWFVAFSGPADGYEPPAEDAYRLTVKVQGEGSVAIDGVDEEVTSSAVFDVNADTDVYFTAQPDSGWRLEKWLVTGDGGGTWHDDWTDAEAMVTMDSDVEVIAVFVEESAPADTTPPVITLNGSNPMQLTVGQAFTDPGATAMDADGACNVSVSGTVNTGVAGTYTITYSAADRSGNQASATRTVVVSAATNPPNPSTPIVGTLSWNGSQLTASFTGATSSVFGFEIYQLAGSAPWVEREVWNVSSGVASGTVTKFRYSLNKTLRFENVTTATAGDGYVDPAKVSWSGSLTPTRVADANGNVAWQITLP